MSEPEPSREEYLRAANAKIAEAWESVSGLKALFRDAGFDRAARLSLEALRARAIDQCEVLLEYAEASDEENGRREYPKIIAALREI